MPAGGASADFGKGAHDVLAQHVEDLRHADQHRHAARLDQADDVVRVEAAREDDRAAHHRRHVGRHRLAEHVAERQQVDEAQRMERPRVAAVLHHLALDRDDVGHHVAMADDDALRLGRRARGEDDLDDVVARDGDVRHRPVGAPVEVGEAARRATPARSASAREPGTSSPTQHDTSPRPRRRTLRDELRRRPVVDRDDDRCR